MSRIYDRDGRTEAEEMSIRMSSAALSARCIEYWMRQGKVPPNGLAKSAGQASRPAPSQVSRPAFPFTLAGVHSNG